jgi:hypothetical protein
MRGFEGGGQGGRNGGGGRRGRRVVGWRGGWWVFVSRWQLRLVICVSLLVAGGFVFGLSSAFGGECGSCGAWWRLGVSVRPAVLPAGGDGVVVVQGVNVGDGSTSGGAFGLRDVLPAGVSVLEKEGQPDIVFSAFFLSRGLTNFKSLCSVVGRVVSCVFPEGFPVLAPFEDVEMRIGVRAGGVSEGNVAEVFGGGASVVRSRGSIPVGGGAPGFGVEAFSMVPEEEGGGVDAQAGSHPFQLTTALALNQTANPIGPPGLVRDVKVGLPAGLVGDAVSSPQCSEEDFRKITSEQNHCPPDSVVGVASVTFDEPKIGLRTYPLPLFNLVPSRGEPARFGFTAVKTPVTLDTSVRTGSDYGVTVTVSNTSEVVNFIASSVTVWGVPSDPRHDAARGWACLAQGAFNALGEPCLPSGGGAGVPFLTLPTSCSAPFTASLEGDSWPIKTGGGEPVSLVLPRAEYSLVDEFGRALGITGCNLLQFDPGVEVAPDVRDASTPTGVRVDVRVPQEVSENAGGLASSSVKDITVSFPAGLTVNPAAADGLEACAESEIGFTGVRAGTDLFTPGLPEPFCPAASKIGTVKIKVPVLAHPLEGALYLAAQNANPFGSLLASYIVAEDPISGVLVKLAGEASLDPVTGQITASFKNSPQAPLEEAEIHLFGGARAPFATPARCGAYTTSATFAPWSGSEPTSSSSTFEVTSGPNGSACHNPLVFAPALTSGSTNINAGSFTPLTTTISREDGNQDIQSVQLRYPPGLSGVLSGIKLCPEAQANAGTCGPESLIGHTIVSVGLGNEPFSVTGGQVFLTESYKGATFGLSIVNPAVAGPFNLGNVIVRAKLALDPVTTALTVTTDQIPHILDGIPLEIKHVNVLIDRPGFTFNPTSCNPTTITGTITSDEAATAPVSVPFQATNCANLKFTPTFQASTNGKTSKANGASLNVKVSYPPGSLGTQANIAKVKVALPKALPSRLTTLQKACLLAVFETNPANCPPASIIGHAKVTTPLLPVPLTGPAYFVSHGSESFPTLTILLQGYGITIELTGQTLIKKGITSTTFKSTPDQPFNTFELTLPQGPYSALAANTNLCGTTLNMPTELTAQNGQQTNQTTKITPTNCPKHHKHKHHHKKKK